MRQVYLDYNATAPLEAAARRAIEEFLGLQLMGNPSSTHAPGQRARHMLETAREDLLALAGLQATHHLVFCSGGTEANHLACSTPRLRERAGTILTTAIEHPSLLEAVREWSRSQQHALVMLPLQSNGRIDLDAVPEQSDSSPLCAVHAAHNEIGTLQDLAQLRTRLPARTQVHADACQFWMKESVALTVLQADSIAVSAHKLGGPLGIGALFVRKELALEPLMRGGGQERGLRAGTESALLAHAFAAAAKARADRFDRDREHVRILRDRLRDQLKSSIAGLRVVTPDQHALGNTLCVTLPHGDGRALLMAAQLRGLAISSGSACSSGAERPSASLLALGLDEASARRSLRFSLGPATSTEDIDDACTILRELNLRFAALDGP